MIAVEEYSMASSKWLAAHTHYVAMSQWVMNTVKREYAIATYYRLKDPEASKLPPNAPKDDSLATKKANTLQMLLRELKAQFEPGASSATTTIL